MPHKRNPVGVGAAIAGARRVRRRGAMLLAAMAQEHERAAGAWQAEWAAAATRSPHRRRPPRRVRESLEGLEVDPDRMRANLDATGGLLLAEAVSTALGEPSGAGGARARARGRAARHGGRAAVPGRAAGRAVVAAHLSADDVDRALDPAGYLGAAHAFVDRALERAPGAA